MANLKVSPCENFYGFACENYVKNTVIHDRYGEDAVKFNFKNKNDEKIRKLLSKKADASEFRAFTLAKTYFNDCLNHDKINLLGKTPLLDKFDELGGWPLLTTDWNETSFIWQDFIDKMYNLGFVENYLIFFFLSPNPQDPTKYLAEISQSIGKFGVKSTD